MSEKQIDRDDCYICGQGNSNVLDRHHIVPRRHGGSDNSVNLVDVCPNCHRALETLYDKRFYRSLGVSDQNSVTSRSDSIEDTDVAHVKGIILKYTLERPGLNPRNFYPSKKQIIDELAQEYQDRNKAKQIVETLHDQGDLYEPTKGSLGVVQ